ncbi:11652_t:CDS:2 [Scutellospora calospora]|uniref:11652_t:CDS:1 n=1 Tax=Scutellospora calospora TaxID=85575 RepID=A0ACA9K5Z5_9GLOM|nr:11652_t:CDS:2 [Scutellospora calospora]
MNMNLIGIRIWPEHECKFDWDTNLDINVNLIGIRIWLRNKFDLDMNLVGI